jgi:hypothetical protein
LSVTINNCFSIPTGLSNRPRCYRFPWSRSRWMSSSAGTKPSASIVAIHSSPFVGRQVVRDLSLWRTQHHTGTSGISLFQILLRGTLSLWLNSSVRALEAYGLRTRLEKHRRTDKKVKGTEINFKTGLCFGKRHECRI